MAGSTMQTVNAGQDGYDTLLPSEHVRIRHGLEGEQPSMLASRLYERLGYSSP